MAHKPLTDWTRFTTDPNPLAKVKEIKHALPSGPGLPAMYDEVKKHGTVLGIPVLTVGKNIFVPRKRVIEVIEGHAHQIGE